MFHFSVRIGNFKIFGINFAKLAIYMRYFGSNNNEGVKELGGGLNELGGGGWRWVNVEMRWVELGGGGWTWVEVGARFSNTPKAISWKK